MSSVTVQGKTLLEHFWQLITNFFMTFGNWVLLIGRKVAGVTWGITKNVFPSLSVELSSDKEVSLKPLASNEDLGAVVAVSSTPVDPAKGSPLDEVWLQFYTSKLDPQAPRHEVYMSLFVQNFMDPGKKDWQEFRQSLYYS